MCPTLFLYHAGHVKNHTYHRTHLFSGADGCNVPKIQLLLMLTGFGLNASTAFDYFYLLLLLPIRPTARHSFFFKSEQINTHFTPFRLKRQQTWTGSWTNERKISFFPIHEPILIIMRPTHFTHSTLTIDSIHRLHEPSTLYEMD